MSTHNLCFEQNYEKYQNFLSENFHFLVVKFSVYLNRRVFVMDKKKNENQLNVSVILAVYEHIYCPEIRLKGSIFLKK